MIFPLACDEIAFQILNWNCGHCISLHICRFWRSSRIHHVEILSIQIFWAADLSAANGNVLGLQLVSFTCCFKRMHMFFVIFLWNLRDEQVMNLVFFVSKFQLWNLMPHSGSEQRCSGGHSRGHGVVVMISPMDEASDWPIPTVDGRNQPPGMYKTPVNNNNGINYLLTG